jgi:predicted transglutaminase-like cysteine proteinase
MHDLGSNIWSFRRRIAGAALIGSVLGLGACASEAVPNSSPMALGANVQAPVGYVQFCNRRPDQCVGSANYRQVRNDSADAPAMSPALWTQLNAVNRDINARIRPASDEKAFGVSNYWGMPLSEGNGALGNCKDYALEKRAALVTAGVPASALSIAIVKTRRHETHAVLLVATSSGEYVLDNLSEWIVPWREAGYTWLARQAPGQPLRWFAPQGDAPTRQG